MEIRRAMQKELEKLTCGDRQIAAVAAASLAMLAQKADGSEPELLEGVKQLLPVVRSSQDILQKNACVALISILHHGEQCWHLARKEGAVSAAVALMGSPKADLGLRLNGAVLAGALIDGGETGARDFYDENGLVALQPLMTPETEAQLLEAAVDNVCKLASNTSARNPLLECGMIGILSGLLGVKQQPETLVRALMALAMLLGNNPAGLLEISDSKRAVENLAIIMRNSKDEDSKLVATTIFSNLANDPLLRGKVSEALKNCIKA